MALGVFGLSLKDAGDFKLSEYSSSVAFVNKKLLISLRIEKPRKRISCLHPIFWYTSLSHVIQAKEGRPIKNRGAKISAFKGLEQLNQQNEGGMSWHHR